jgi:hypothetical protein
MEVTMPSRFKVCECGNRMVAVVVRRGSNRICYELRDCRPMEPHKMNSKGYVLLQLKDGVVCTCGKPEQLKEFDYFAGAEGDG